MKDYSFSVTHVTVREGFRLFVRFVDGLEGEVDMSALVKARDAGVFAELADHSCFRRRTSTAISLPGQRVRISPVLRE